MNINKLIVPGILCLLLMACASQTPEKMSQRSYLQAEGGAVQQDTEEKQQNQSPADNSEERGKLSYLSPYQSKQDTFNQQQDMVSRFSDTEQVTVTSDGLPLQDYLHYVLGELLGVSYILGEGVEEDTKTITLNLQQPVSKKRLFLMSQELLLERGYLIRHDDDLFYVQKSQGNNNQTNTLFSYGNRPSDVPDTTMDILQLVPFNYGSQTGIAVMIERFVNVKTTAYPQRDVIMLQGKRQDILRGMEFIEMMDQPQFQNREIAMYRPTYVSLDDLKETIPTLMDQEGIRVKEDAASLAVSMVALDAQNILLLFANKKALIERAVYWAEKLDKPSDTEEEQYFIYQPQYSRAVDLGESLELLIGDASPSLSDRTSAESQNRRSSNDRNRNTVASNENIKMVVDERANSLIFLTTGKEYKQILPLIKRLDIMPKQIALEVMIAEVTLTDRFSQGVEFFLEKGNYELGTEGAFNAGEVGGLSYVLTGASGKLTMNLLQTDSLVNVLSRPSLVVRDGISAQINVGTDIPVVVGTTIDANDSNSLARTSIEYRKTGVKLDVTPTVNAQGVVTMVIKQSISSEVSDVSTVSGSPAIFERAVSTEVIAADGQTILLGGLISENSSEGASRVPFLSDLPVLGHLFKTKNNSGEKTELVVMVTPRIIANAGEWQGIKRQLSEQLKRIQLN